jgi:histidinol-phosphate aminotransferase
MEVTRGPASPKDLAPENVRKIAPYVPGKPIAETARELGLKEADILKMASNENPLGPSPKAVAAIRGALAELNYYPDGAGYDLKAAISRRIGVAPEGLVLGNGSNDVLELAARAFLTTADSAVYSQHAFMVYPLGDPGDRREAHSWCPRSDYGNDLTRSRCRPRRYPHRVLAIPTIRQARSASVG